MDYVIWLMLAAGACFLGYLVYTRQFRWIFGVVRNMFLGIIAILGLNMLVSGLGIAVGVNAITVLIVGLLGLPGFLLLYATRLLVG